MGLRAAFTNYYTALPGTESAHEMRSRKSCAAGQEYFPKLTITCHNDYPPWMPRGLQAELKQNIPFRTREQEAYLSLLRTTDSLEASVEAKLKEFGLTGTQYNALRILRGAGQEGLPCSEIGERMITHDPDVTRLLNRLEKRGLVARARAKGDRRVIYGKITLAGLKLLREMDAPLEQHGRELLKHVGQPKLQQLIELLELVRDGSRDGALQRR